MRAAACPRGGVCREQAVRSAQPAAARCRRPTAYGSVAVAATRSSNRSYAHGAQTRGITAPRASSVRVTYRETRHAVRGRRPRVREMTARYGSEVPRQQ